MSNAMLHLVTFKLGMAHSTNDAFECARDHCVIIRQACFPQFDSTLALSIVLHASLAHSPYYTAHSILNLSQIHQIREEKLYRNS